MHWRSIPIPHSAVSRPLVAARKKRGCLDLTQDTQVSHRQFSKIPFLSTKPCCLLSAWTEQGCPERMSSLPHTLVKLHGTAPPLCQFLPRPPLATLDTHTLSSLDQNWPCFSQYKVMQERKVKMGNRIYTLDLSGEKELEYSHLSFSEA